MNKFSKLTKTNVNGFVIPKAAVREKGSSRRCEEICKSEENYGTCLYCPIQQCFERLADYENAIDDGTLVWKK